MPINFLAYCPKVTVKEGSTEERSNFKNDVRNNDLGSNGLNPNLDLICIGNIYSVCARGPVLLQRIARVSHESLMKRAPLSYTYMGGMIGYWFAVA